MISQALRDARRYEEVFEKMILPEERPAFHLSSRVGWMNDPNGFSIYKGEYHLFYQYHPYDSHWGPMHWGHAVSKDLLHWKYLPAVLAPDMPYDRDGCFSGGALTMKDGTHMLMYTGVCKELKMGERDQEVQTQCIAFGDGENYTKYDGNPVLVFEDLPEECSRFDFRDPRIWQEEDGTYKAAAVSYSLRKQKEVLHDRNSENSDRLLATTMIHEEEEGGQILLFSARDPYHWKFEKKLAVNGYRIGRMWECPDLFELDGKQVILASAMDMLPDGLEYHNGNGTFCLIGEYDRETGRFVPEADQSVDYGIDFYAEQTVLAPDGRRIMIAWMQNWDTCNLHTKSIPWFGQMTLPRELSVKDGRLYQWPIRELLSLRRDKVSYENVRVTLSIPEICHSLRKGRQASYRHQFPAFGIDSEGRPQVLRIEESDHPSEKSQRETEARHTKAQDHSGPLQRRGLCKRRGESHDDHVLYGRASGWNLVLRGRRGRVFCDKIPPAGRVTTAFADIKRGLNRVGVSYPIQSLIIRHIRPVQVRIIK